jgi:predicted Zn-dependent peptidase
LSSAKQKPRAVESSSRDIHKTTLANGACVVTERMPHVRSIAVGVWVKRGSRHETAADHGLTHFTEHMVFKGTAKRSAEEIAGLIDGIGGHLDASPPAKPSHLPPKSSTSACRSRSTSSRT